MKQNSTGKMSGSLTVVALACAISCTPTWAEETPQKLQRVEVTGSNIKRIDTESASPVQIFSRRDIAESGVSSVSDFIATLASSNAGLTDISGSNSFAPGASSASLRNLGKQSVLVLLNSRRISAYPVADYNEVFSNLDTLPLSAVDRIEILKSGGSSIYGSDAVAGVINIITRKEYQGLEASASYTNSLKNHKFGSEHVSLTGGWGNLEKDRFNVLANVDFFHRNSQVWADLLDDVTPDYKAHSPSFGTPSSYSYPGNVIGVGPVAGCTYVVSKLCRYDRYQRFQVTPQTDRINTLVSAHFEPGGSIHGYAEGLFSHIKTEYSSAFAFYGLGNQSTWSDPNTDAVKQFVHRGLPTEHPLNPTGEEVEFRYRFVDSGQHSTVTSDQYRVLAGLQGTLGKFDWDTAIGMMGGKAKTSQRGAFSDTGFKEMIGDYDQPTLAPDFFNKANGYKIGQTNSAAVLDRLFPEFGISGETSQTFFDVKFTGDLAQLEAGPIGLATGLELRHETMKIGSTGALGDGDLVGYGISQADGARTFGAVFAELNVPITKQIEMPVALRVDKFPGFDTHLSPKIGIRYQPSKQIILRSTWESGFRAPNLTEAAASKKTAFQGWSDPKRCPQATNLANDLQAQAAALPDSDPNQALLYARADKVSQDECSGGGAIATLNNAELKPEVSRSFTLGLVFEPVPGISTSVDFYKIHRQDEINLKDPLDLLNAEDSQPKGVINRSSLGQDTTFKSAAEQAKYGVTVGKITNITGRFENVAQTTTSGIDWAIQATTKTDLGTWNLKLDSTYLLNFQQWISTEGRLGDNQVGRYGFPRWSLVPSVSLDTGNFSHNLRLTFSDATELHGDLTDVTWTIDGCKAKKLTAAECHVASTSRWDYGMAYKGSKNLTVGFNLTNIFNRRPPIDYRDFLGSQSGIFPSSISDAQGRMLKVGLTYKFM